MPQGEILTQLRKIVRGLNLESKRIQKEFGISIPQLLCLEHLKQSDDFQSTTKAMSDGLNLNPSTISGIVSRLEKRGYVARLPKRNDRRVTYISLTAEGERLLEKVPRSFAQKLEERLDTLPLEKKHHISRSLDTLIQILGPGQPAPDTPTSLLDDVADIFSEETAEADLGEDEGLNLDESADTDNQGQRAA
jgi:DNA-binding MarR family transcriptional regulator